MQFKYISIMSNSLKELFIYNRKLQIHVNSCSPCGQQKQMNFHRSFLFLKCAQGHPGPKREEENNSSPTVKTENLPQQQAVTKTQEQVKKKIRGRIKGSATAEVRGWKGKNGSNMIMCYENTSAVPTASGGVWEPMEIWC